ncbi:hypothetical protein [Streptomyces sp. MAA16]|uniref:hypothetical protein n=1 Tax=Streptomyces sp. MAA16 TaxID=3035116 RepID=UPI002472F73C|nr:hypothetical protein [Streptomyces sp. MAA16]MDH6700424.1 integrase [Streptomyces sp. MAA16]
MTTATAHALAGHPLDDELVLAARPLTASADLATTSRFRDDIWDLSPALHMAHQRLLKLNFTALAPRFRTTAKELFFALLRNDHPYGEREQRIQTIHSLFSRVKAFLVWVDERGVQSLAHLGQDDFEAYDRHVTTLGVSVSVMSTKRAAARALWLYRSKLSGDTLSSDPQIIWDDNPSGGTRPSTDRRGENRTVRIPEEVLAPLLTWALRWVEDFSDDILRAQREWMDARTLTNAPDGIIDGVTAFERLAAVLDRYRAAARPLPRLTQQVLQMLPWDELDLQVNVSHLAREANMHVSSIKKQGAYRDLVRATAADLGVGDACCWAEVHGLLDGRPWLPVMRSDDITEYVRLLQAACYIVVAYLSGMRDSEVKHMKRGCLTIWCDDDGRPVRHKITSQAFKGENNPEGVEATWIVNAAAAKAIRVLEALQAQDLDFLFALPPTSRFHRRTRAGSVQTSSTTIKAMTSFMQWINSYCSEHGRTDGIPQVNGRTWQLETRQFRRTLAWSIARQPGGSIAGAIQYRHHSIQMFEGYAGTSASGFRPEVEAEAAIARGEKLGDMILNPAPHKLTGPAAEEAEARLAAMESEVQFLGKVITDRKRLDRFMRRNDPHIYPGEFVTCIYNPDRALCRREAAGGPSLPDCQPLKCRNVALTSDNKDAFTAWLGRLDAALANATTLAPYTRIRLTEQRDDIAQFLAANDTPSTTEETR